jgi:hypothetical protein
LSNRENQNKAKEGSGTGSSGVFKDLAGKWNINVSFKKITLSAVWYDLLSEICTLWSEVGRVQESQLRLIDSHFISTTSNVLFL